MITSIASYYNSREFRTLYLFIRIIMMLQLIASGRSGVSGVSAAWSVEEGTSPALETCKWRSTEVAHARAVLSESKVATLTSAQVCNIICIATFPPDLIHPMTLAILLIKLLTGVLFLSHCPNIVVHGGWTEWNNWTPCTVTCGNGTTQRHRSCTNPQPQYGGVDCKGPDSQIKECFLRHCPVHCQWLEFSEWSACSLSCDNGTQYRSRGYVSAKHGGEDCTGDLREIQLCNTQPCPGENII